MIKEEKKFSYKVEDGVLEIKLVGEIDHHSAVGVRSDIDELIFELRPQKVVLNLSEISFMDSSGLGLIMGRYALMQKLGGGFSVANPNDRVVRIFELAGLGRIIRIENETESGILPEDGKENEKEDKEETK